MPAYLCASAFSIPRSSLLLFDLINLNYSPSPTINQAFSSSVPIHEPLTPHIQFHTQLTLIRMALAVQGVQNVIGYTFADPYLVREAVSAAGSIVAAGPRRFPNGNKRLALLGDTVLQLALAEDWYDGTEPRGKPDHSNTVSV